MAQASIIDKCDLCDSVEDVSYFCTNCEVPLCSKCKVSHARRQKTKNDRIIPLSQSREDGIVHKSATKFCREHSLLEVTLFCLKCNQLVCTHCFAGKHSTHQVVIPDETRSNKALEHIIKTSKEKKDVFENVFDNERKVQSQFSMSNDQVGKDIDDQEENVIDELNLLCSERFSELTTLQQNNNAQEKENREKTVKSKLNVNVQNAKTQEQKSEKTCRDNKQLQKREGNKLRIFMRKVKVKSTVQVKEKLAVYVIVPLLNKTAWIHAGNDRHLTLIDSTGKIITTSIPLGDMICDARQYGNGLLVTCYEQCEIYNLSTDGKSTSTFSDLSPYYTRGLWVTHDMNVMVCLYVPEKENKVVRLNASGHIIQTLQHDVTGTPLYNDLYRVTSLTTWEVIVIDANKIVGVDNKGKHLFTWEGEMNGKKLDRYSVGRITVDNANNLFATDWCNNRVFVLEKDGSGAMCLLDGTYATDRPWGIAVDDARQLWVGCSNGRIHIIEYCFTP